MIDPEKFEFVKKKYGWYASWAIWVETGDRPKDNVGDLSIFDAEKNPGLFLQLNPGIILVGLNISRGALTTPLANFHDARSEAMDYKIRYALAGSLLWGAYMTDIIKDFDQKNSGKVMGYLRKNRQFEEKNARMFREEIHDLGHDNPLIVAFGRDVYTILKRNLSDDFRIIRIPHYSNYCSREKYREEVHHVIRNIVSI